KFNDCHRSGISAADTRLDDTSISALTLCVRRSDLAEQLLQRSLSAVFINDDIADICSRLTACVQVSALCQRNELVHDGTQLFGFHFGCFDLACLDQGSDHVTEHGLAVIGSTS